MFLYHSIRLWYLYLFGNEGTNLFYRKHTIFLWWFYTVAPWFLANNCDQSEIRNDESSIHSATSNEGVSYCNCPSLYLGGDVLLILLGVSCRLMLNFWRKRTLVFLRGFLSILKMASMLLVVILYLNVLPLLNHARKLLPLGSTVPLQDLFMDW